MIDHLRWDSDFLGLKTGRLLCGRGEELLQSLPAIKDDDYQLVYVFSDSAIDVEPANCRLFDVGGQVTYYKSLEGVSRIGEQTHPDHSIGLYQGPRENDSLLQLAFLSGQLSRFRVDPLLPFGSFECLYKLWLYNSLENKDSSRVYIAGSNDDPKGMLTATWRQGHGTIDLLAVRQDAQGMGIGSKLLEHCENEAIKVNVSQLYVKTQLTNDAARRAYERNAYTLKNLLYLYHLYL